MKYALGNMLNGAGGLNADGLSLDLQFATDKTLTARKGPTPTFTRASSGTFVGSNGLIQSAAINAPRFDHNPVTLACKGLLIEESRTNLTWPSIYTTANSGVSVFPAGSATITLNQPSIGTDANGAALIRETATTQVHGSYVSAPAPNQSITILSGTVYTASIFVKADGRTKCRFSFNTGGNNDGIFAAFDLSSNGSIITNSTTYGGGASTAGLSATITKYIDGWFRLTVSGSLSNTASYVTVETLNDAGNRSFLGDITKGVYIANAQLEAGSFATSYIPTTTASVIRSADVCSITGSAFSGFYNQLAGTLYCASTRLNTITSYALIIVANDNSSNNQFGIRDGGGAATREYLINRLGVSEFNSTANGVSLSLRKMVIAAEPNNANRADSGAIGTNDSSVGMPVVDRLSFGANHIFSEIKYYKKRLPNAKLQSLTV